MKRESAAWIAVVILSLIWGYNWVAIKVATTYATPFVISALRTAIGALCLFIALAITRRSLAPTLIGPTIVLGLLQTTAFTFFQTLAVSASGAGSAAVLSYTMPFWVLLFAWPFLGETLTPQRWGSVALAACGLLLVVWPLGLGYRLEGEIVAVIGAIFWGGSVVYAKRLRERHPVDLLSLTAWQMLYGTIPLALAAAIIPGHRLEPTPAFYAAIAYVAIPGSALGWLLWLFIVSRLSAGVAGISALLTPVIGVLAAWLQLGERPSATELIGIGFIVAALILNTLSGPGTPRTVATRRLIAKSQSAR